MSAVINIHILLGRPADDSRGGGFTQRVFLPIQPDADLSDGRSATRQKYIRSDTKNWLRQFAHPSHVFTDDQNLLCLLLSVVFYNLHCTFIA